MPVAQPTHKLRFRAVGATAAYLLPAAQRAAYMSASRSTVSQLQTGLTLAGCRPSSPILRPRRMDTAEELASIAFRSRAEQPLALPKKIRTAAVIVSSLSATTLVPPLYVMAHVFLEADLARHSPFYPPQDVKFPTLRQFGPQAPQRQRH